MLNITGHRKIWFTISIVLVGIALVAIGVWRFQESAEFKALKPNSDYVSLAKTAVFDPVSVFAGVASPVYDASGNYMIPALNGEIAPAEAAKKIRDDLQALAK